MEEKVNDEVKKAANEVTEQIIEKFNLKDQNLVLKCILTQIRDYRKNTVMEHEEKAKEIIDAVNEMENFN